MMPPILPVAIAEQPVDSLPPGIAFNAISREGLRARRTADLPRSYWDWEPILKANENGYWPYTPNTNLLYALSESLDMILAEGLADVFDRHIRLSEACRAAVRAWGLEIQCSDPAVYSLVLTGVVMPDGVDADQVRKLIYEQFNLSLGRG
jgi:alanine-glyoxylate transaminase / serine-glyoxylate transaminase / serine-pyruvate transaminase